MIIHEPVLMFLFNIFMDNIQVKHFLQTIGFNMTQSMMLGQLSSLCSFSLPSYKKEQLKNRYSSL